MKKYIYMSLALSATMFTACNSDNDDIVNNVDEGITVFAQLPQEVTTRVSYADESEGSTYSLKPSWEENDQVKFVYWENGADKQRGENAYVTISTGAASINKVPATNAYVYAYHPKDIASSYSVPSSDGPSITLNIASKDVQYNVFGSLEDLKAKNILIGNFQYKGDKTSIVQLKNVYALVKFQVKVPSSASNLTSITIGGLPDSGTDKENITARGNVKLTSDGTISWESTSTALLTLPGEKTVSLTGDGEYKEAVFYALVVPQTFTYGLNLEVRDDAATPVKYYYLKEGEVTLDRGYMYCVKAKMSKTKARK